MIDLASLVVRLVADTRRFAGDLDRARARLTRFAESAKAVAKKVAVGIAAAASGLALGFAAMVKQTIDAADNLNDLSKALGISTETLSQLQYAAEQSGTSLDGVAAGLKKLSNAATDAAMKGGSAAETFRRIGVSVTDANGRIRGSDKILLDIAQKFAGYKDGAAKAALAVDIFGKSGAELIPFLNQGKDGISALMREADRLGLTLKTKTAKQADDFNDALDKIKKSLQGQVLQAVTAILPKLVEIANAFADIASDGVTVQTVLSGIGEVFRFTTAAAARVSTFVGNFRRQLGALAAIVVQTVKLNFAEAKSIYEQNEQDQIASELRLTTLLESLYGERRKKLGAQTKFTFEDLSRIAREVIDKQALKDVPLTIVDPVQEITIKLKKIQIEDKDELEEYFDQLERQTRTAAQTAIAGYDEQRRAIEALRNFQRITQEDANARLKEQQTALLLAFSQAPVEVEKATKEINEYQLQAARNTQDIIASTFESLANGSKITAKSILQSFGQMIIQLAAQAAAADLAGRLFGESAGGKKGSTGLVGTALGFLGGFLGRDSGGRGRAGGAYMIGKGAQPELFIPDRSGTFIPAGAGGMQVTNNFTVMGGAPLSKRTELQIAAAASRGVERANRRNN